MSEQRYYPLFLDIKGRPCVVIGGGEVAERKVESLLEAGGAVSLISPEITPRLRELAEAGSIAFQERPYRRGDLKGSLLAYIATGDRVVGEEGRKEADAEGVLLNVVDIPDLCGFIVPSIVKRGALQIAISTSGKSPAYAKALRKELESCYGEEVALFLEIMGAVRRKLLTSSQDSTYNKKLLEKIVSSPIIDLIREGRVEEIDPILLDVMGRGYTLDRLEVEIERG